MTATEYAKQFENHPTYQKIAVEAFLAGIENAKLPEEHFEQSKLNMEGIKTSTDIKISKKTPYEKIEIILKKYNTNIQELSSRNRKENLVMLRYAIFITLLHRTHMTKTEVGKLLYRDHATVLHAEKRYNNEVFAKQRTGKSKFIDLQEDIVRDYIELE